MKHYVLMTALILSMMGCSEQPSESEDDELWQQPIKMIDRARDVEIDINAAVERQRQSIEQPTR